MLDLVSTHPQILLLPLLTLVPTCLLVWGWSYSRRKLQQDLHQKQLYELSEALEQSKRQSAALQEQAARQYARIGSLEATERLQQEQSRQLQQELLRSQRQEQETQSRLVELLRENDTLTERYNNQTLALKEKQALLESTEQRLAKEFENLANRIFEQKSQAMRSSNELSLENLLKPFREQIAGFQQQVQQKSEADSNRHTLLQKELDDLKQLNLKMSEEALNLTRALKGENKTQGNWGEVILQSLLDQAGLTVGREYEAQVSLSSEQGQRLQPDVVVHLPQGKDIVIDSKVTLTAYERFVNAQTDEARQQALQGHVLSLKTHIKELGKKNYHELKGLRTLDYVLLFVPIESAFLAAVQQEPELIRLGLDQNIMLVSPTNLMMALRTIHNIWQVDQQNRNAQEIADRASKLYDKFVGFVDDLDKVGAAITKAGQEYDSARSKLVSGSGNLVRQATLLQELGVKGSKQLSDDLVEQGSAAEIE